MDLVFSIDHIVENILLNIDNFNDIFALEQVFPINSVVKYLCKKNNYSKLFQSKNIQCYNLIEVFYLNNYFQQVFEKLKYININITNSNLKLFNENILKSNLHVKKDVIFTIEDNLVENRLLLLKTYINIKGIVINGECNEENLIKIIKEIQSLNFIKLEKSFLFTEKFIQDFFYILEERNNSFHIIIDNDKHYYFIRSLLVQYKTCIHSYSFYKNWINIYFVNKHSFHLPPISKFWPIVIAREPHRQFDLKKIIANVNVLDTEFNYYYLLQSDVIINLKSLIPIRNRNLQSIYNFYINKLSYGHDFEKSMIFCTYKYNRVGINNY
ncbi:RpoD-like protein [Glossina pallidipes salivary gland hypertrophy virus]|uniref:RpoD-like protein n=1 Tax=Glossina hytrovirus (isolate Glossina pallidipes/Ethiopia/Seibersdorf/-) TaxID=379529 RepID=B0YLL3_GHVS|nr:RpoD-like protein [Glossina pallidipes salivary gland hypertrophy virus]ABQ08832.1 RpoD-like protein [Glossina pallidipes salivary gland hypertrophy virus]